MHDRNGKQIKLGQIVKVEFIITGLHGESEFCNVNLETVHPMPGNGQFLTLAAINSKHVEILEENAEPQPFDTKTKTWVRPPKDGE